MSATDIFRELLAKGCFGALAALGRRMCSSRKRMPCRRGGLSPFRLFGMVLILCGCIPDGSRFATPSEEERAVARGLRKGALVDLRLHVIDDEGNPVEGAVCHGWMYMEFARKRGTGYEAKTDSNGDVRVAGKCGEWMSVILEKENYYRTTFEIKYPGKEAPAIVDGKWQPYGETKTVVLKRVRDPIEMVKSPARINSALSPGEWCGYDLVLGDWITPFGEGKHSDVLIRTEIEARNDVNDFRVRMDLCFTNNPWAGIYRKQMDRWSEMRSDYRADVNEIYQKEMSFVYERHPYQTVVDTRLDADSYLVFRIRTQLDKYGCLESAHYGKIYGLWTFFSRISSPDAYFNPTPNDTNLEDADTARRSARQFHLDAKSK